MILTNLEQNVFEMLKIFHNMMYRDLRCNTMVFAFAYFMYEGTDIVLLYIFYFHEKKINHIKSLPFNQSDNNFYNILQ